MKIEIKGKVTVVGEPVQKSEKFTVQTVVISKFFLDENEEKVEKIYPFQVTGDSIGKLDMKKHLGKTVVASGFLNGVMTDKLDYFVNLRLNSVTVVEKVAADAGPSSAMESENRMIANVPADDLPF